MDISGWARASHHYSTLHAHLFISARTHRTGTAPPCIISSTLSTVIYPGSAHYLQHRAHALSSLLHSFLQTLVTLSKYLSSRSCRAVMNLSLGSYRTSLDAFYTLQLRLHITGRFIPRIPAQFRINTLDLVHTKRFRDVALSRTYVYTIIRHCTFP